jgi:hypothetical protein
VANLPPVLLIRGKYATSVVDTDGKFAASVVDNGGKLSKVGVQMFFKSANLKSANSWAQFANKIHKFLRYASSKISNLQISFERTAHCKSANFNFPT